MIKILITETQLEVLRRVYEIDDLVDYVIHHLNKNIKPSINQTDFKK